MKKIDIQNIRLATRSTSREINRQIVLNMVREHQPLSRAELARRMKVDRASITPIVNELLVEGQVYEGDTVDAPRGRKPRMLHTRTRDRLVIGVDVRFSHTYLLLSDFAGTQLALEMFPTVSSPMALVDALASRIHRILETHADVGCCEGIGLVIPGVLDRATGRVLYSLQTGWREVDVRELLAEATGLPVHIENAPNACALAQMWLGKRGGELISDFVYVTVSDGVGTGIVANRELVRGRNNAAGEFGHILIDPQGPRCFCGARGCWEAHTSNLATLSRYLGLELTAPTTRQVLEETAPTMADLITRARVGDTRAREVLEETGRYLGMGLGMIINALNPERIFVGGEITAGWDLIQCEVNAAVAERSLSPNAAGTTILPDQSEIHPRLRGAVALVAAPVFAAPAVA